MIKQSFSKTFFVVAIMGLILLLNPKVALAGPYMKDVCGLFGLFAIFYFLPIHLLAVPLVKTWMWKQLSDSKSQFASTLKKLVLSFLLQILWIIIGFIGLTGIVAVVTLFSNTLLKETFAGFFPWILFFIFLDYLEYRHNLWLYTSAQKNGFSAAIDSRILYASPMVAFIIQIFITLILFV